ncbi:MAG: hypothetical protein ACLUKN_01550 [Bacilli bacterium]
MGFSFSKFNRLPDNGEKLQGFIVYPSAIMVALAPIAPTANVMKQLSTYTTYTDPQTGLTFEYRAWGDRHRRFKRDYRVQLWVRRW